MNVVTGRPPDISAVGAGDSDRDCDVARVIEAGGWTRLPPAVRRRFAKRQAPGDVQLYRGVMAGVASSRAGWLLAQLARLIGTPLAPFTGKGVPVFVAVYPDPRGGGTIWDRVYSFPGRRPITVRSSKQLDRRGRMVERVGGGFGMVLRVYEAERALHFVSERYFFGVAGLRLALPHLLSPGQAHVVHADLGGGRFRFRITVTHPLLGRTFDQDGVFWDEGRGARD